MIYSISDDFIKLEVDNHGAETSKLVINGLNIIRQKDDVWGRSAPFLFPIVGCLKDGYTIINDKKYNITKHGFLRDHDLTLVSKTKDTLAFIDTYNDTSLKMFPFKYELYVTYKLINNGLITTLKVKNIDNVSFKYNIGGHPGFNCPFNNGEDFNDYKLLFEKEESFATPSYPSGLMDFNNYLAKYDKINEINLDYKLFEVDALVIKNIKSRVVYLLNKNKKGIKFTFNNFNTLALWTKPYNKYICLEPWRGYDDLVDSNHLFDTKADLVEIKPGEEKEYSYTIELI